MRTLFMSGQELALLTFGRRKVKVTVDGALGDLRQGC